MTISDGETPPATKPSSKESVGKESLGKESVGKESVGNESAPSDSGAAWGRVQERMRLDLGDNVWRNWIKGLVLGGIDDGAVVLHSASSLVGLARQ